MSFYQTGRSLPQRFRLVLASFLQASDLPFSDVLTEEEINEVFEEEESWFSREEGDVFTPPLTLWAFLSQVLYKGEQRSCLAAVSRVIVLLVALGREPCANNSGGYCKARAKLPEVVLQRLATRVADGCEQEVPEAWLWKGRHVKLADGTTVSMPDTEENQAEYPQQASQKRGLGFPVARMVVLLSLATAMLALLVAQNTDFVTRLHHARKAEAYCLKRLGKKDYLIQWPRPQRPGWMDRETYDRMPKSLTLRQIEVNVSQPGFRVESLVIVTTLTDPKEYTQDNVAELYHKRWLVELDIRAIKCSLSMDVLRCKTPEMVRREIWTCLLAYNLIRKTMLQTAMECGLSPRQLWLIRINLQHNSGRKCHA